MGTRTTQRSTARSGARMFAVFVVAEVAMVAVSVLVLVSFAVTDPTLPGGGGRTPWPLLALLVIPPVAAALVAVAGTALAGAGPRLGRVGRELAVRWSWRDLGIGLAFGSGGLALTIPAAVVWSAQVGDDASSALGDAFSGRQLHPIAAVVVFVMVWLVAPLSEEVLFRGALWRALEHWRWNRWLIFAATGVVFSFAHLELLRTPLLLVLSIPIGLARMVTGNLLAAVVAHQVNNFLPAVALLLATTGSLP